MSDTTSITFNINHCTVQDLEDGQFFMWGGQLYIKVAKDEHFNEHVSIKDGICMLAIGVEDGQAHPFFPEETITPAQVDISVSNFA